MSTEIALARKQRVFAIAEDTVGTLKFPTAASFILPAGDTMMNQNPEFVDSEELRNTLDVLDQFQNATPAGEFTVVMYARPSGTIGSVPQGDILFQSLQGSKASTSASLATAISSSITTLTYDGCSGAVPEHGIVQIGSEYIYYDGKTAAASTAGTLTSLTRGYNSTTATQHANDVDVTLKSVFYKQTTSAPSFSLWIETDHFIQGMSGCTVDTGVISVSNEGADKITMSGQGMQMVWAGTDALTAQAASSATQLYINDADRYSTGSYIQNYTASDTNSGSGYEISRVDSTNNIIAVGTGISATWATSDVIKGYLPTESVTGSPIEGRHTTIELNNVSARFRNTDITINAPKQYLTDEVGVSYPEEYVEDVRDITSTINIYFKKEDAKYFAEGYAGNEIPIEIVFGNTIGSKMVLHMKKCKLEVPRFTIERPTISLSMPMKALGTSGEDSCEIRFE